MKLRAEIIEVATNGDGITIVMQAKIGRAAWMPIERQILRVANTIQNRRAFYLGRIVTLEIKTK